MKKVFLEPEMQRIELNLRENIAASQEAITGYYFMVDLFGCTIVDTNKKVFDVRLDEAVRCLASPVSRSIMMFYPKEEVLPHFGR